MTYDKYYQEFSNEVHSALASYLFWKMLQNKSADEPDLLDALNRTPLSWIFIRHSLQVSLFMTLGRIFDTDDDSFSIDDLLKCCIEDTSIFDKNSLRTRKQEAQRGTTSDWLDEYIANASEPVAQDFKKLRGEVTKHRRIYVRKYQPIRHKIFAHRDKEFLGKNDDLWKETNIGEIEDIIWFLNDLKNALFQTYENGRALKIVQGEPDVNFYEDDFSHLLHQILEKQN